jgi:hypothetical protein
MNGWVDGWSRGWKESCNSMVEWETEVVLTVPKFNHKTHSKTIVFKTIVLSYWFSFFLCWYSQSVGMKL